MDMLSYRQAAELAGVSVDVIRKHVERGKLRATKVDGQGRISEEDLQAYVAAQDVRATADEIKGKPLDEIVPSMAELIRRLPAAAVDAILEGAKTGSPEPWRKFRAGWTPPKPATPLEATQEGEVRPFSKSQQAGRK